MQAYTLTSVGFRVDPYFIMKCPAYSGNERIYSGVSGQEVEAGRQVQISVVLLQLSTFSVEQDVVQLSK